MSVAKDKKMLQDFCIRLSAIVFPSGLAVRLILTLLFITSLAVAQETERRLIPDGTMGEYLEPIDSLEKKKFLKNRIIFTGRFSSLRVGMGFLYEFAGYSQDAAAMQQMDSAGLSLENQFKPRDFRILVNGQLRTKRMISWKAGLMYDGPTREWFMRESGVTIAVPEISGHIFVGRTKEGYSLNKVMNGYAGWTMERQMALDVIPILADGIKWIGFWPKKRILWNVGIYDDFFSRSQAFSTYSWQTAARIGWLPIFQPRENKQLHLGLSYRFGKVESGEMRLKSRPESNPAPFFIDTDNFKSKHSNHVGAEIYYTEGPLMIGSEYHWHKFEVNNAGKVLFHGGEAVISYILTGASRPYSTTSGVYAFVPVNKSVFKGGFGELEGLVRISNLDLDGGVVAGGRFWRLTPMINWYMSRSLRFELAYGYGILHRFELKGATQFFHARIQVAIL
ncbi:porin outer membrane protein [Mariniradius saccharolyticus AK6]|uniref:Porin outer membrane protein n=1 Tax=Mariniradius saccharolyticus AK6 TaxID=1239962 RepID=M7Y5V1_9BACT|nr:porin [Mariniradius saccharolyticus]EMS32631.1 porin outer membrane protein [Mariniradius saccharolyticus AK6]